MTSFPRLVLRHPFATVTDRGWQHSLAARCSIALAGSAFVALCAHVSVALPVTPVPFTFQPFAVLLVGMLFGPAVGFGALAAYLCEGALSLPVFTPVGAPGVARLLGPTGGYLFAYPFAAALAGWFPRLFVRWNRFLAYALAGALAMLLVYASGAAWFSSVLNLPFTAALTGAILPFAGPDAIKVCIAAAMVASLQRCFPDVRP